MMHPRLYVLLQLAVIIVPALAADRGSFSFIAMGDTPYLVAEEVRWEKEIERINAEQPAFVLHVGDIKSGHDRCDDAMYRRRHALFSRFAVPFVLIPGDNDWTDCHRSSNGGFDPVERLKVFREVFYRDAPNAIGGSSIIRQRGRPENMRWTLGGVVFITLNVSGSHNGLGISSEMEEDYRERTAATLVWLADGFKTAKASSAAAVVVAVHANPHPESAPGSRSRNGYEDFVRALQQHSSAFSHPVLLIHGDTHRFKVDRPLSPLPNLTRLEVFGAPTVGWVRVTFDPALPAGFRFEPES